MIIGLKKHSVEENIESLLLSEEWEDSFGEMFEKMTDISRKNAPEDTCLNPCRLREGFFLFLFGPNFIVLSFELTSEKYSNIFQAVRWHRYYEPADFLKYHDKISEISVLNLLNSCQKL